MSETEQIKAIAEMDNEPVTRLTIFGETADRTEPYKPYLTSYDAIIPVCHKQKLALSAMISIASTPAEIAESLLRATGKWKD